MAIDQEIHLGGKALKMIWLIIIVAGSLLYGCLFLFFCSLGYAAKRGDEILIKSNMVITREVPRATLPFKLPKSITAKKLIPNNQADIKTNTHPQINQIYY